MWSWLRRLFWLALLTGAGYAAYLAWQRKGAGAPADLPTEPPRWPPLSDASEATPAPVVAAPPSVDATPLVDAVPNWVTPVDGECPEGFPIKVNVKSGIYHVPGGRFYARAVPDRCYLNEASAEADGYRRAKA